MNLTPEQFNKPFKFKWSYKKFILYFFLSLIPVGGFVGWNVFSNNKTEKNFQQNRASIENNNIVAPVILGDSDTKNISETIVEKEFNKDNWIIDRQRFKEETSKEDSNDKFFCASDSKNFDSAIIWYKEKISLGATLKLRYALKSSKVSTDNVPKLIFAYGDESNFRIFLPEDTENKFIGIEKINSVGEKSRNHNRLIGKIDSSKENVFEITIKNSSSNKASFLYNLKYFPLGGDEKEVSAKQILDSDSFEEYLPWVDPGNIGFKQNAGVGVFNNTCVKIISATWSEAKL